jgi:hypothetical protein
MTAAAIASRSMLTAGPTTCGCRTLSGSSSAPSAASAEGRSGRSSDRPRWAAVSVSKALMWKKCDCRSRGANLRHDRWRWGPFTTEAAMSRWTDEELRELITLWPTHSVRQVADRLRRPCWAILSKAKRLRLDGLPPHNPSEGVDVGNPPKRRPLKAGSYCRSAVRSRLPPGP